MFFDRNFILSGVSIYFKLGTSSLRTSRGYEAREFALTTVGRECGEVSWGTVYLVYTYFYGAGTYTCFSKLCSLDVWQPINKIIQNTIEITFGCRLKLSHLVQDVKFVLKE